MFDILDVIRKIINLCNCLLKLDCFSILFSSKCVMRLERRAYNERITSHHLKLRSSVLI